MLCRGGRILFSRFGCYAYGGPPEIQRAVLQVRMKAAVTLTQRVLEFFDVPLQITTPFA